MAVCDFCGEEMLDATSCMARVIDYRDGRALDAIRFGAEQTRYPPKQGQRCSDCGVVTEGYHHPGCEYERCPNCRQGQLLSCSCEVVEQDDQVHGGHDHHYGDGRNTLQDVLGGVAVAPLPEGATPVDFFLMIKYENEDGSVAWAYRAGDQENKPELLGNLMAVSDLLRKQMLDDWDL